MCKNSDVLMDNIILIGYGGHGKSVADAIESIGKYHIVGYTDMIDHQNEYQYLGKDEVLPKLLEQGYNKAFICLGYLGHGNIRETLAHSLKEIGFTFPVIADKSAVISTSTQIGEGTFIGKRAVINRDAVIGKHCIINTGAIVEHDCFIKDYTHVAVGAVLCGQVNVGEAVLIGANATVIQCRSINDRQIVPAGVVIR